MTSTASTCMMTTSLITTTNKIVMVLSTLGLILAISLQLYMGILILANLPNNVTSMPHWNQSHPTTSHAYARINSSNLTLDTHPSTSTHRHLLESQIGFEFRIKSQLQIAVQQWITNPAHARRLYGSIQDWDTSKMRDLSSLFENATEFSEDLSAWNVSSCQNFSRMFYNAHSFRSDLNAWTVSQAVDFSHMFDSAISFNGDLSSWHLESAVYMNAMMKNATSFNGNVKVWLQRVPDDSKGGLQIRYAQTTQSMFESAASFEGHGLKEWNTAAVIDMSSMFRNAQQLDNSFLNLSWNVRQVRDFSRMFQNTPHLIQPLCWDIDKSARQDDMFDGSGGRLECYLASEDIADSGCETTRTCYLMLAAGFATFVFLFA